MATRPGTLCAHPMCGVIVPYGTKYCDKHKTEHRTDRKSSGARGYDSKWQRARKKYLRLHPLCCMCKEEGRITTATVVDHIKPHRGDQKLFWDESNWQPLCKPCHDRKTWREDAHPTY